MLPVAGVALHSLGHVAKPDLGQGVGQRLRQVGHHVTYREAQLVDNHQLVELFHDDRPRRRVTQRLSHVVNDEGQVSAVLLHVLAPLQLPLGGKLIGIDQQLVEEVDRQLLLFLR